ncbi:ATH1 [Candida margitis]|uniref:ATH1 n=1 Tax=Candida margitis TaxID=1775924 RepID=UPI00222747BC|nr:ATH1 [Candida margitis]KAI5958420.1 ATH1 [Candida margitis]
MDIENGIYIEDSSRAKGIKKLFYNKTNKVYIISMTIVANFLLFYSLHLLNAKYCEAFPFVLPRTERYTLQQSDSNLGDFVNSFQNKEIFSQLQFGESAFYDRELNVVGTIEFSKYNQYQNQPYVANGYIGSRIPNLGQGFTYDQLTESPDSNKDDLYNGWPLFDKRFSGAFMAGFYNLQENTTGNNFPELLENGYESVISAIPQWTTLKLVIQQGDNNYTLDPALPEGTGQITNYVQNMSLSTGIVTTQFTWLEVLDVKYTVLAHRSEINLGLVKVDIQNNGNDTVELSVIDELNFDTAQRCELNSIGHDDSGIYVSFSPDNLDYISGAIYSTLHLDNVSRRSRKKQTKQSSMIRLLSQETTQLGKTVGIVSTDLDPAKLKTTRDTLQFAKQISQKFEHLGLIIKSHVQAWKELMGKISTITFPNDSLLDLGSKASAYHLLANTRSDAQGVTGALGVGGLSSDSYGGMVFWDTDFWMFNAILALNPGHAKSIVNYRMHTHQQALNNTPQGCEGAVYPWTSGRFGNCTATGPCLNYEYHINSAIAMAAWELYISGAVDEQYLESTIYPLINDAAKFYSDYVTSYNDTIDKFVTNNLTDPDEYANHVDNGAYTNAGIALLMNWINDIGAILDVDMPKIFAEISQKMYLPTADNSQNITLEYSGMNSSVGIKQADVVLLTYPLQNSLVDTDQAYTNMEFYSGKQVSYGPAMTFSIFSIVASNLASSGCASQSYLHRAIQPYLRGPFVQFSEQNNDDYKSNGGTHPAFPFLTAHGGFVQAVIHGLTGLRHTYTIDNGKMSRSLNLDPIALPCLGNGVQYSGIHYDNHTISMNITDSEFVIRNEGKTNKRANNYITITMADRNPEHGTYKLKDNEERTFKLFQPSKNVEDSLSECGLATFYNITESAPGDSSFSINDGDNTTRWQVKYNDTTGKVLIDLHTIKNISGVTFNWADRPPKQVKLSKYADTKFNAVTDFLAKVDFGNPVYKNYRFANPKEKLLNQSDVFELVHSEDVPINAPFSSAEFQEVLVPVRHNTTSLDINLQSRFLLLEVDGIHNTVPIEDDYGGAKIAEVSFY